MTGTARLEPPEAVVQIARKLEEAGHETWCVGGAVRDALLGLPSLDWDLATAARPEQVRRLFRRTVPVGEKFGTIGVLDEKGVLHEVTTFRHDVKTDGRHAEVEFGASLDEDLARRDFTVNAIAWSPSQQRLHDPFGGQRDLSARRLRAVGDAAQRMQEDRLRALRGLRFAGRFGLQIDDATWRATVSSASALHRLSKERVQQELVKTLEQVRVASQSLLLWKRSGALRELLPVLDARPDWQLRAADSVGWPDASAVEGIAKRRVQVRLAAVLCGLTARESTRLLTDIRLSNRDVSRVAHLATVAGRIRPVLGQGDLPDLPVVRGWASEARRVDFADALRVAMASLVAEGNVPEPVRVRWPGLYRRAVRCAWRDPIEISDLVVDGEDLMRSAGIPAGRELGEVLRGLLVWVVDDPSRNTRELLMERARTLLSSFSG